ncbi:hypothetical protein, partial [Rhodospirillum rubrum]|uniref:hypothetical protein n=1 Tax=Rhodospirillum rubrum TaxID=1085 RepID=UPI0028AD5BC2
MTNDPRQNGVDPPPTAMQDIPTDHPDQGRGLFSDFAHEDPFARAVTITQEEIFVYLIGLILVPTATEGESLGKINQPLRRKDMDEGGLGGFLWASVSTIPHR